MNAAADRRAYACWHVALTTIVVLLLVLVVLAAVQTARTARLLAALEAVDNPTALARLVQFIVANQHDPVTLRTTLLLHARHDA